MRYVFGDAILGSDVRLWTGRKFSDVAIRPDNVTTVIRNQRLMRNVPYQHVRAGDLALVAHDESNDIEMFRPITLVEVLTPLPQAPRGG